MAAYVPTDQQPTTPSTPIHHHHLPLSPTVASSPPLTMQPPASTLTSLCNISSDASLSSPLEASCSATTTTTTLPYNPYHHTQVAPAEKQAALTNKFKLSKGLPGLVPPPSSFNSFRASLLDESHSNYSAALFNSMQPPPITNVMKRQLSDMDITNSKEELYNITNINSDSGDIKVMSPTLANRQVFSKTRPLSPLQGSTSETQKINYHQLQFQKDDRESLYPVQGILKPEEEPIRNER